MLVLYYGGKEGYGVVVCYYYVFNILVVFWVNLVR